MNKKKAKLTGVVYIVQNEVDTNEVYVFTERPVMCEYMSGITEARWAKDTIDHNFGRNRKTEMSYRGYSIYLRHLFRGKSRGRYKKVDNT